MTELRDYILSKLQEQLGKAERNPAGEKAVADWKMKRRVGKRGGPVRVGQSETGDLASTSTDSPRLKKRGSRALGQTSGGMTRWSNIQQGHSPDARQNASTDLRTQLAYVLADKLEELKIPIGGIPRDESGRVSRDAPQQVAAGALATARTGKVPDKRIKPPKSGVVDLATHNRANWRPATGEEKQAAGRVAAGARQRAGVTLAPRPDKPKPPKPENASTDLRTQLMYILADKLDEARPGGSVEKLRNKLKLATKSNPKDKENPFGQDARGMDARLMRAARNPDSEAGKTSAEIQRDARRTEESPSRGGKPPRSGEGHPSYTNAQKNSGHNFNKSRTGY